jgi:hypothetical protein
MPDQLEIKMLNLQKKELDKENIRQLCEIAEFYTNMFSIYDDDRKLDEQRNLNSAKMYQLTISKEIIEECNKIPSRTLGYLAVFFQYREYGPKIIKASVLPDIGKWREIKSKKMFLVEKGWHEEAFIAILDHYNANACVKKDVNSYFSAIPNIENFIEVYLIAWDLKDTNLLGIITNYVRIKTTFYIIQKGKFRTEFQGNVKCLSKDSVQITQRNSHMGPFTVNNGYIFTEFTSQLLSAIFKLTVFRSKDDKFYCKKQDSIYLKIDQVKGISDISNYINPAPLRKGLLDGVSVELIENILTFLQKNKIMGTTICILYQLMKDIIDNIYPNYKISNALIETFYEECIAIFGKKVYYDQY